MGTLTQTRTWGLLLAAVFSEIFLIENKALKFEYSYFPQVSLRKPEMSEDQYC